MQRQCKPSESRQKPAATEVTAKIRVPPPEASAAPAAPPFILPVAAEAARLNDPDLTTADDLGVLTTLLQEYRRHLGGNPVGDNVEITAALLGANPKRLACLPSGTGTYLDNGGRLIDRWGTPYFFHQLSATEMEIRSAGPDRLMWTGDDSQL